MAEATRAQGTPPAATRTPETSTRPPEISSQETSKVPRAQMSIEERERARINERLEKIHHDAENLSDEAKAALAAFTTYYDVEGSGNTELLDGGIFEDEFTGIVGLNPQNSSAILEELLEVGFIIKSAKPRTVTTPTVWPTTKGLVEGRKIIPEIREKAKEEAMKK